LSFFIDFSSIKDATKTKIEVSLLFSSSNLHEKFAKSTLRNKENTKKVRKIG
jgi:hypothetical protein